jgi:hypothetical protein
MIAPSCSVRDAPAGTTLSYQPSRKEQRCRSSSTTTRWGRTCRPRCRRGSPRGSGPASWTSSAVKGLNVYLGKDGTAFCLSEAPDADAVVKAHDAAGFPLSAGDVVQVEAVV